MADNKMYPKHLFDPIRRKIATQYAQLEMRKLLPDTEVTAWPSVDEQIDAWYDSLSMKYFWNAIHGISMGFRLTSYIPWITSQHIKWSEESIAIDSLFLSRSSSVDDVEDPHSIRDIQAVLHNNNHRDTKIKITNSLRKHLHAGTQAPEEFPIFVIEKEGKLRVIDGNHRLLQAAIDNETTIHAFVGRKIADPPLYEHWIPTQILVELVFWHEQAWQEQRENTDQIANTLYELIRHSTAGQYEFANTAVHSDEESHQHLLQCVQKKLTSSN